MNGKSVIIVFIIIITAILITGCGTGSKDTTGDNDTAFPRNKTLYLAGDQWGEPNSFNPLYDWPAFPIRGKGSLMYEPLMVLNTLTGKMEPCLAHSLEKSNDVISVVLDHRACWSDSQPVTAADVVFTFEIGKRFKSAFIAYLWDLISDITVEKVIDKTDPAGERFLEKINFFVNKNERNNPLAVLDQMQAIRIVPKHYLEPILEKLGNDFSAFLKEKIDKNPVISGPYNIYNYSSEKIVLKRRDDYWGNAVYHQGKLPGPQYIIHPIFKGNDAFSIALQKGNLDVSSTFIPRIWMKEKSGVRTWYKKEPFFVPATIPMLMINHTRYPLSDKQFRRAMARAINYKNIRNLAISGYSPDVKGGIILPFGVEKPYFNTENVEKFGAKFDPEAAKKILKEAGYTSVFDSNGKLEQMKNAKGEKVPTVFIKSPAGWSDWESMVKIAVKDMRAIGIDVREGFVDASLYWQAMPFGDFDLLMHKPEPEVKPSTPWSRLDIVMSSRNWKPEGEKMNENQGRYNNPRDKNYNPAVDSLLKTLPRLVDETEKRKAYSALNKIFMEDQVTLPLTYLPEQFYEFSIKNWAGWATEENPYAPPQSPFFGLGIKMLWHIKPTKN